MVRALRCLQCRGLDQRCLHRPPTGEVVVRMRPVCVFANGPDSEIELLRASLRGRWRQAARAVMVLLALHGLSAAPIAVLLDVTRPRCAAGSAGSAPKDGRAGPVPSDRSTAASATAQRASCSPPPRPGPAHGFLPVTSRTSGMPLLVISTMFPSPRSMLSFVLSASSQVHRPLACLPVRQPRVRSGGRDDIRYDRPEEM
jgi:hypothetical protein